MEPYLVILARKLARTMLLIKATSYRKPPLNPYKWASGMLMRIYNDNRMMLGCFMHRMRIGHGFCRLIEKMTNVKDLYILGTSMAGIAPAATVAQLSKRKLVINHEGTFYLYKENLVDEKMLHFLKWQKRLRKFDTVISTTPFAIAYGVQYANSLGVGFAYIRKPKDHGKEQSIEGNLKKGAKIVLLSMALTEEDRAHATETRQQLQSMGYTVTNVCAINADLTGHQSISSAQLQGITVVVIEDLFSTGGSAAYEVFQLREVGAMCNHCFSIFSYEFEVLKKQFSGESMIGDKEIYLKEPCTIKSLLPFSVLKAEMERMDFYTPSIRQTMVAEIEGFDKKYAEFLMLKEESTRA